MGFSGLKGSDILVRAAYVHFASLASRIIVETFLAASLWTSPVLLALKGSGPADIIFFFEESALLLS